MPDKNDDLWNEAMALLLRWQAAPDDAAAREAVRRFCAHGNEHLAAWESVKRLYRLTGEATGAPAREEARRRSRTLTRRAVLGGLGTVAVGGAALEAPRLWRQWQADMVSAAGIIDQRVLADGTKVTLGPDSAIQIAYSPTARTVRLMDGMALFDVADDPRRPFEARAGDYVARADPGSSFEVRQNSGRGMVGVDSGRVAVDKHGGVAMGELGAGDWIASGPRGNDPQRGRREAGQIAAWRNRQLIADEDRIDAVVAEIARWQSARVVIADWGLAEARVSGLYDLRDPVAALEAVASPYGARVRRLTPWLIVLSSV